MHINSSFLQAYLILFYTVSNTNLVMSICIISGFDIVCNTSLFLFHMRTLLIFHLLALIKSLIEMLNRILNQMEEKSDLYDRP